VATQRRTDQQVTLRDAVIISLLQCVALIPGSRARAPRSVVAYASIAWLLRFVADHPITVFVAYRLVLGAVLVAALATGTLAAV
jgi:undecaprenyl pyrophosphate phosphatase UppP